MGIVFPTGILIFPTIILYFSRAVAHDFAKSEAAAAPPFQPPPRPGVLCPPQAPHTRANGPPPSTGRHETVASKALRTLPSPNAGGG